MRLFIPIQVIAVAALISFLFKQDADVSDFEDKIGKMQPGDKDLKPANLGIIYNYMYKR